MFWFLSIYFSSVDLFVSILFLSERTFVYFFSCISPYFLLPHSLTCTHHPCCPFWFSIYFNAYLSHSLFLNLTSLFLSLSISSLSIHLLYFSLTLSITRLLSNYFPSSIFLSFFLSSKSWNFPSQFLTALNNLPFLWLRLSFLSHFFSNLSLSE